jgi:Uma2 family endonuclease
MSTATAGGLMTAEEFLALPDDPNIERMLIRGRVWEEPMTRRNKWHSSTESTIAHRLWQWKESRDDARGTIASGEAGCLLRRDPDSVVGIDAAYFPEGVAEWESDESTLFDGPPLLAVEILSPNDTQKKTQAKVSDYLAAGVKLGWLIDPIFKTVVVHRPDAAPEMFSGTDELSGEPHLPGLRVQVSSLFVL